MTQARALEEARELKSILDKWWTRTKCSIELLAGRGTDPWAVPNKYLRMHHHTAAAYRGVDGNLTPALGIVKEGRPDVIGPLANGYGGFDLRYRILCMGLANHPGTGGPITIDGVYIPKDSARGPTWGTEWEGGLQDYETIPGMMDFMAAIDCGLAEYGILGEARPLTSQLEHSTWTDRKIDRRNFTRTRGIALTTNWYNLNKPDNVQEDDDMTIQHFYADGVPMRTVVDGHVTGWRSNAARQAFVAAQKAAGIKQATTKFPTKEDFTSFSSQFTETSELREMNEALDAMLEKWLPGLTLYAAATLEVETREEERDKAALSDT